MVSITQQKRKLQILKMATRFRMTVEFTVLKQSELDSTGPDYYQNNGSKNLFMRSKVQAAQTGRLDQVPSFTKLRAIRYQSQFDAVVGIKAIQV